LTYFEIDPVVLKLARDAHLACLTRDDTEVPADERSADDLAPLAKDSRWQPGRGNDRQAVWTDDYSSLLRVSRWR
jgi:hypothetical protein